MFEPSVLEMRLLPVAVVVAVAPMVPCHRSGPLDDAVFPARMLLLRLSVTLPNKPSLKMPPPR